MPSQGKAISRKPERDDNPFREAASLVSVALIPLGFLLTLAWLGLLTWGIYALAMLVF